MASFKRFEEELNLETSVSDILSKVPNIITDKKDCVLCKKRPEFLPASEYMYNMTSMNYCEFLQINTLYNERNINASQHTMKIAKALINKGDYVIDSTFPLYHNHYCFREEYTGSRCSVRKATQMELSLYYIIPKLIYYITGNEASYNHAAFVSNFTEIEYLRFGDILAGVVHSICTQEEVVELEEYFTRDQILLEFWNELKEVAKRGYSILISPLTKQSLPVAVSGINMTATSILSKYICVLLSPFLACSINVIKKSQTYMNLKSLNDFRLILEVKDLTEIVIDFTISAYGKSPIELRPRVFNSFERLTILGLAQDKEALTV